MDISLDTLPHGSIDIASPRLAGYSVLQGPSCSLIRPHPAVWRLVHGVVIVYLCFLVFLMFQTPTDARLFMRVRWPPQPHSCRGGTL